MRGADGTIIPISDVNTETSPHAWSRCHQCKITVPHGGNISTCVEQISFVMPLTILIWKHLHMRGADLSKDDAGRRQPKHLHMRGADSDSEVTKSTLEETSPHAWSRSPVEQITIRHKRGIICEKHLHMRGADFYLSSLRLFATETSPHAWSRSCFCMERHLVPGNISTCVEQISADSLGSASCWKHLHMRGADLVNTAFIFTSVETSPHAWSRLDALLGRRQG